MYDNLKKDQGNSFFSQGTDTLHKNNEKDNSEFFKNFDFEIDKLINLGIMAI